MKSTIFHWRRLLAILLVVSALFILGLQRLKIDADIMGFLPRNDPVIADALYIFRHNPIQDQLVIDVSLDRTDSNALVEYGRQVEKNLRASGLFKKVGMQQMRNLIPELALHIVSNLPIMFGARQLEEHISPLLAPQKIRKKLAATQINLFSLDGIGQAQFIAADPLEFKNLVMARLASLAPSQSARIYKGQILSSDGRHLLVIAHPNASSTDTQFARRATTVIDAIAGKLNQQAAIAGDHVTLTPVGAYRAALDNELIVRHDVRNAIVLATAGIILLLLISFPRPYIGLLSLLPAVAGAMLAFFVFSLLHRSISLMVLGFGGAIISISVDHGIAYLLFVDRPCRTYGKQASAEVKAVGLVAVLTTIGAFAALNFSGFPILAQLGQFTALGIAFAFIFVHSVFPLVFPVMAPARPRPLPLHKLVEKLSATGKKGAWIALSFAVIMLFFAKPDFNVKLSAMNTVSRQTAAADKQLATVWGWVFNKIYVLTAADSIAGLQNRDDRLLELVEQDKHAGTLSSGFVSSMIFPGENRQRQNLAAWKKFWTTGRIIALKKALTAASRDLGFAPDAFEPFFKMLQPDSVRLQPMPIPSEFFGLLGIVAGPKDSSWLQVSTLSTGPSYDATAFYARYRQLSKVFDPQLFSENMGKLLFATFVKMLAIVGISVAVLLLLFFFDITLTVVALLPIVFGLVSTLGTLKLIGHPLDIPGLMLAIIVIGMGIDYSLFFVRSYQRYGDSSHPFFGLIRMTVFLAAASTIIGFGVLCTAQHALLKSAGLTSLLGIGYCLIGAFVILPPVLERVFQHRRDKSRRAGTLRQRLIGRYHNMEAYPRLFARFKFDLDPMFSELPQLLNADDGIHTILDIGCGYGVPSCWLLERFPRARIYGIDPDPNRVRIAARAVGDRGRVEIGRAPEILCPEQPAELAVMMDIMHYLSDHDLPLALKRIYQCLAPGGRFVVRAIIPPKRRLPWIWWLENFKLKLSGTPAYYRSVAQNKNMLLQAGFTIEHTEPSGPNGELIWMIARIRPSA
jgi:predicted exporter/2-polyprenyl-3-methyl-5-hydroxy-6-metoxy-1,4-benzoquinol methylase